MKLWLIKRIGPTDYDENAGFVIRAETEEKARKIAALKYNFTMHTDFYSPGKGDWEWLDEKFATCKELTADGPEDLILEDYRAG